MKLYIDGVEILFDHQVKVVYEDEIINEDGDEGELHVILTDEGLIADLYEKGNDSPDCDATMAWDIDYFISQCI